MLLTGRDANKEQSQSQEYQSVKLRTITCKVKNYFL